MHHGTKGTEEIATLFHFGGESQDKYLRYLIYFVTLPPFCF